MRWALQLQYYSCAGPIATRFPFVFKLLCEYEKVQTPSTLSYLSLTVSLYLQSYKPTAVVAQFLATPAISNTTVSAHPPSNPLVMFQLRLVSETQAYSGLTLRLGAQCMYITWPILFRYVLPACSSRPLSRPVCLPSSVLVALHPPSMQSSGLHFTTTSHFVHHPPRAEKADQLAKERRRRFLELTKQTLQGSR